MLALALALALGASPHADAGNGASDEPGGDSWSSEEEAPRLDLEIWGGQAWNTGGTGPRVETYGGQATWRFDQLDLGLFGGCYGLQEARADGTLANVFAPVYLVRIGQRFETRNGLLASFTFGVGTAKAPDWRSWFQVALGARASYGPAFLAGEVSFESDELIRLSVGLGVSVL